MPQKQSQESPVPISQPIFILVEGKEDVLFFTALARHLGLKQIQIEDMRGKTRLRDTLQALKNRSGFEDIVVSLAIIRDADDNPKGAFQSVCSALKNNGLPVPPKPFSAVGESPRVTVMILPDANTPGKLEDVCLKSVETNPALACVDQFFTCLDQEGVAKPKDSSKARLQVYLASVQPELRIGEAAEKGTWDWNHAIFQPLKDFLLQVAAD